MTHKQIADLQKKNEMFAKVWNIFLKRELFLNSKAEIENTNIFEKCENKNIFWKF